MPISTDSDVRFLFDTPVPMRDGVRLSADVYLPLAEGRYPAILSRTPYDNVGLSSTGLFYARHGYVFVAQDVRGRGDSDGRCVPIHQEAPDGYDTIEWIAQQPWCNGRVGMTGASYLGMVQWQAAKEFPPHLVTLVSTAASGRWMHEAPYMNGVFMPYHMWYLNLIAGRTLQVSVTPQLSWPVDWSRLVWRRPLKDLDIASGRTNTVWRDWLAHPNVDDYWRQVLLDDYFRKIDLPVLHVTGWFDADQWGQLYYYNGMTAGSPARDKQFLLIGPWDHAGTVDPKSSIGGLDFGPSSAFRMIPLHLRWFDYWLRGEPNGQENDPKVKLFVMGRNEWVEEKAWPLPDTQKTPYYLHGRGRANTLGGDGGLSAEPPSEEPADSYVYDPENPTPSEPDLSNWPVNVEIGTRVLDDRFVEQRDDVLVYTSEPLETEIEVTGHPFVVLYAASDAVDTDFYCSLNDVYPDGRSVQLSWGIMRASYRDSLEHPAPIEPGTVHRYVIELNATSNAFLPGHRMRVDIMSARFPLFARNPNTGAPAGEDEEMRIATQTVHHSAMYPSHVLLPVIPSRH